MSAVLYCGILLCSNKAYLTRIIGGIYAYCSFVTLLGVSFIYNKDYAIYWSDYTIMNPWNLWYFTIRCLAGFCSIMLCLLLFQKKLNKPSVLTTLGKETYSIYILQFIYCSILQTSMIKVENIFIFYTMSIALSFFCIIISIGIIRLIRRSAIVSKFLLG